MKKLLLVVLLFMTTSSLAENTAQIKTSINNLFEWVNTVFQHKANITDKALRKYFAPHMKYVVNGFAISSSISGLQKTFARIVRTRDKVKIQFPLNAVLVEDNKIAVSYKIQITKNGQTSDDLSIAILTLAPNGKILTWHGVDSNFNQLK